MAKQSNGAGSLTSYGNGYRLRWQMPDGTRKSRILRDVTKTEARAQLRAIITDVERGDYSEPEPTSKTTFAEFAKQYLEAREPLVAVGTFRNWKSLLNTTLLPAFDTVPLDQISQRRVDLWWSRRASHPVNRRNAYFLLRSMMRTAVKWGLIPAVPFEVENAGRDVATPRPVFEMADLNAVLAELDPFYRPAVEVLLSGHVRLGELVALDAGDYDRKTGKLRVERQRTGQGLTTDTKTGQRKTIVLMERGRNALNAMPPRISGPLFPGERGERITRNALRNAWKKAATEAGLPDFHIHDLRHVGLSLVAEVAGLIVAQERAGHASATSTRRYLHTSERVHQEAVEKLDALVRRIS